VLWRAIGGYKSKSILNDYLRQTGYSLPNHVTAFFPGKQEDKLSVEGLARIANLSRRSFIRRFKAATANTPLEYMQRVNVEKAKRQLENGKDTIEQIIYSLGYNDLNSFRKIFVRYIDLTPKEYRGRYGL
jgi:transcriptional regulator GlxA family with amidase domain